MEEAKKKKMETSIGVSKDGSISVLGAFVVYLITDLFLGVGFWVFWVAGNIFSVDLVTDPSLTLFLLWRIEYPVVAIIYSNQLLPAASPTLEFRFQDRSTYPQSFLFSSEKLFGLRSPQEELKRIIVIKPCLISGPHRGRSSREKAFVNALGAIALGAPIGMRANIVWLHGLGDNGSSSSQLLESLPLPNIKWICPTVSSRPVSLLGGFPCTAWFDVGEISEATRRAASIPVILAHGTSDDVVPYKFGEKSAHSLAMSGFRQVVFKPYEGLGHYTVPKEMDEVVQWLASRLGLEGWR